MDRLYSGFSVCECPESCRKLEWNSLYVSTNVVNKVNSESDSKRHSCVCVCSQQSQISLLCVSHIDLTVSVKHDWRSGRDDRQIKKIKKKSTSKVSKQTHPAFLFASSLPFFVRMQFFLSCVFFLRLSSESVFCQKQQCELTGDSNPDRREPVDPVVHRLAEG